MFDVIGNGPGRGEAGTLATLRVRTILQDLMEGDPG